MSLIAAHKSRGSTILYARAPLYALSAEPIVFAAGVVERIGVVIKVEDRARSRASLFEQIESHLLFECNFRSYDDNGIGEAVCAQS